MKRKYQLLRKSLLAAIGFFALMALFGFSLRYSDEGEESARIIARLQRDLQDIRAAMNADSVRQYNIQKIMSIIERYNKDMSSEKKYEIANEVYEMSMKYTNLDVDLICATISHESAATWNPKIVSRAGAIGLMQIMPATGMYLAKYEDITWTNADEILADPIYNIRMGCRYLSSLISYYGLEGGLAAYNGGEKLAALWLENNKADGILWAETRDYVPAVVNLYKKFQDSSL
ncbi:lytic transglycosylase domain-containing protein [candidate division KSB1 bacterium]|nr:lytic transglycosylase domain-containing protein [candidate division KSB1 bacterium]